MTSRAILVAVTISALVRGSPALAQSFPARSGETGILDVPDAETSGIQGGELGAEFRFDRSPGVRSDAGPLPLYVVGGVAERLDLGLTAREWGQPGDLRPSRVLFGAAGKLQIMRPTGPIPGAALSVVLDRFNDQGVLGARLALSTTKAAPHRVAAFAGAETDLERPDGLGFTAGVAASIGILPRFDAVAEALTGPRGRNFGGALRYRATRNIGLGLGANYFPREEGLRIALTVAFAPTPRPKKAPAAAAAPAPGAPERIEVAGAPQFRDARPGFRLKMPVAGPARLGEARHLQHGTYTRSVAAAGPVAPAVRASAPSLEDLAESQLREQETLAVARDRRIRATSEQLDGREKASLNEARRLEERERELAGREQQLDSRQQRVAVKGPPTQQQRQLESLEAQLASQERNLSAQERSFGPALDAAQGRERDAIAREDAERQEASRLAASVGGASSRALQLGIRKQALGARNRQLAALEARLVAKGEHIDALERQLSVKAERLETWSRRLDTRSERLDLLEKRMSDARQPRPPEAATPPKDKAVFVMVVKSPTAIMKERGAAAPAAQPGTALHPGVAVEKAVAAATVVMFPTPATQLSELDREAIDNIAKLAAKERCELLIWARAKDPGLMAEAQRRAAEIKTRVLAVAALGETQVVTRITTRPGAQGVDVVISALRETAKPSAPAAAPAGPAGPTLAAGETGKRQIREAVQTAQGAIEVCVGEHLEATKLQRAEGVLKLTVSMRGKVTNVTTGGEDLAGTQLEECLKRASAAWAFPSADADYFVDVPITVMRGGPAK